MMKTKKNRKSKVGVQWAMWNIMQGRLDCEHGLTATKKTQTQTHKHIRADMHAERVRAYASRVFTS